MTTTAIKSQQGWGTIRLQRCWGVKYKAVLKWETDRHGGRPPAEEGEEGMKGQHVLGPLGVAVFYYAVPDIRLGD